MTAKRRPHRRRMWLPGGEESGQALLEVALTLPVFCALLIGAIEIGRVTYEAIEVTNAARAGAQYATMNGGGYMDSAGIAAAAQNDAYNLYKINPANFSVNSSYTCSCSGTGTASCTAPNPPTGCTTSHLIVKVTVTTQATFDPLFYLPVISNKRFTLKGKAIQEVVQ